MAGTFITKPVAMAEITTASTTAISTARPSQP